MTKNSNPTVVTGADPQRSPEALRRLGRAVIGLARWQLDGAPPVDGAKSPAAVKSPSNTKAAVSSKRKRPGGGKR